MQETSSGRFSGGGVEPRQDVVRQLEPSLYYAAGALWAPAVDQCHSPNHLLMSQLLAQLQSDLNASRKAGDKPATLLLGTIISDVKNREIELKRPVTDEEAVEVLRRGIKKRRE